MPLIGYARISTEDQTTEQQVTALRAAGCARVVREVGSGASRARPELARLLAGLRPGDVLAVVRIDRLARSLQHLLEVIDGLARRGVGFRSLADPIDTTSPQGRLTLQILGAVAEFERALIAERTRAGLARAAAAGRRGGNPGLMRRAPLARAAVGAARTRGLLTRLRAVEDEWLPAVRDHRPHLPWRRVAVLAEAARRAPGPGWTEGRLRAAARAYVAAGRLDAAVLGRAARAGTTAGSRRAAPGGGGFRDHAVAALAALKRGDPSLTNQALARRLDRDLGPPPRGDRWAESTVRLYLREARARGMC